MTRPPQRQETTPLPTVYVFINPQAYANRSILAGLRQYLSEKPAFRIHYWPVDSMADQASIASSRADAYIISTVNPHLAQSLAATNRPVIEIGTSAAPSSFPRICPDQAWIGRCAAQHFKARRLHHFAFIGFPRHHASQQRKQGFCHELNAPPPHLFSLDIDNIEQHERIGLEPTSLEKLRQWLPQLPPRTGLLAFSDRIASAALALCLDLNIAVPESLAILGIDNDPLIQESVSLPLSSIDQGGRAVGYQVAQAMSAWLANGEPARHASLPTARLHVRRSTDTYAVDDPSVLLALDFISENLAREELAVDHIANAANVSRRVLERRFRSALGSSIRKELERKRVERALLHISETDLPLKEIAALTGLGDNTRLAYTFRRVFGHPPSHFR